MNRLVYIIQSDITVQLQGRNGCLRKKSLAIPFHIKVSTQLDLFIYLFRWCSTLYTGIFHLYEGGQDNGGRKLGIAHGKPTTIRRLLDLVLHHLNDEVIQNSVSTFPLKHSDVNIPIYVFTFGIAKYLSIIFSLTSIFCILLRILVMQIKRASYTNKYIS